QKEFAEDRPGKEKSAQKPTIAEQPAPRRDIVPGDLISGEPASNSNVSPEPNKRSPNAPKNSRISLAEATRIAEISGQGEVTRAKERGAGASAYFNVDVRGKNGITTRITLNALGEVIENPGFNPATDHHFFSINHHSRTGNTCATCHSDLNHYESFTC